MWEPYKGTLSRFCCYDKLACSDHHVVRSGKNEVGGRVGRVRYYNGESTVWVGSRIAGDMGAECPLFGRFANNPAIPAAPRLAGIGTGARKVHNTF